MKLQRMWAGAAVTAMVAGVSLVGSTPGSAAENATASPVKVMLTGTISSPSISYPSQVAAATVASKFINKSGGISGHPIQVVTCNDSLDANTSEECVKQAIAEHVVAIVGTANSFTADTFGLLDAAKIPWVGLNDISTDQWTNKMSYPLEGGEISGALQGTRFLVKNGYKNINVFWVNLPQGAQISKIVAADVKTAGGTLAGSTPYTLGAADFSSNAAQVVAHNPSAVFILSAPTDTARLIESLRQAGFKGAILASQGSYINSELAAIGSQAGVVYSNQGVESTLNTGPSLAEFKKEAASTSATIDENFILVWLSLHVIADALKAGSGPLTAATVIHQLNTNTHLPTYGLVPSINFTGTAPNSQYPRIHNLSEDTYIWKNGNFTPAPSK